MREAGGFNKGGSFNESWKDEDKDSHKNRNRSANKADVRQVWGGKQNSGEQEEEGDESKRLIITK